ncbi:MAG: hypothetical protein HRT66_05770 [Flavobacteriaceae bacterium]|nr:hypothetical protein [Flavobacteriaceae bacterium]
MEKLTETLKTFLHLSTQIKFITTINYTYRDNNEYLDNIKLVGYYKKYSFSNAVSGNLQNYAMIIICSFLDELNKELTPKKHPGYSDRIMHIKKSIKQIIKRINKWTNLQDYRNNVLAHNFREKNTPIFSNNREKKTYKIPYSNSEHYLLSELILLITQIITKEFDDIVSKIDFNESLLDKIDFIYNEVDVQKEYNTIQMECLNILNK